MHEGDVVVTHHLPTQLSVHPEYKGSPLNPFFVCEMDPLIFEKRPKLWVHGHTHKSVSKMVGRTRIVCNPFGYARHEENPEFSGVFTVEI